MTPKLHLSITPILFLSFVSLTSFAHGQASKWKGTGVSAGAPLPPAENFKPRPHGPELTKAGLKPGVTRDENTTLEEYSRSLASQPLLFHPGEKYQYGTSTDVLGRMWRGPSAAITDRHLPDDGRSKVAVNILFFWASVLSSHT